MKTDWGVKWGDSVAMDKNKRRKQCEKYKLFCVSSSLTKGIGWVVTESIFSMETNLSPLTELNDKW